MRTYASETQVTERAKKYYKHILNFELYSKTKGHEWQKIKMLADIRNAFAHTNGRFEMLKKDPQKKIKGYEQQKIGISFNRGYIVCDANIVRSIFDAVNESLEDLISRYKSWDDQNDPAGTHTLA